MRLLNIESSPRGSKSASIAVTNAFLETYRQVCPGVMVDTLNVWEEKLPDFGQEAIGAKYKGVNKEPMDQAPPLREAVLYVAQRVSALPLGLTLRQPRGALPDRVRRSIHPAIAAGASQVRKHLVAAPRPLLARAVAHLDPEGLVPNVLDQLADDVPLGTRQVHGQQSPVGHSSPPFCMSGSTASQCARIQRVKLVGCGEARCGARRRQCSLVARVAICP